MLTQKLPVDRIENTIMEQELITRFVEPVLSPLFEDNANDIFLGGLPPRTKNAG